MVATKKNIVNRILSPPGSMPQEDIQPPVKSCIDFRLV